MSERLLASKFHVPPPRPGLVARPRLLRRLENGLRSGHRLLLVSAPAGYGKTTLLSDWVAGAGAALQTAWLSLEKADNDLARFLGYLTAALEAYGLHIDRGFVSGFHRHKVPPVEMLLTPLLNELESVAGPSILILDDYHEISAPPIHRAVTFMLEHLPPQIHLVIASRADPPLPLARLRARSQMTELRQADLRFTLDEAAQFLNRLMGLGLSAQDVAGLTSRTEGWVAGLQLAAVSLAGRDDVGDFVSAFTGSDRHVLDYLIEEVLGRQPKAIQTFLLQTAILDRLSGPLCDAVGGGEGSSQEILEYLDRANLFVVPLDGRREWYRYHRLFSDLLRHRLRQTQPGLEPVLHARAGVWYEQQGFTGEAVDHALAAGDWDRAAWLIERAAEPTLMRSEVSTLIRWLDALPDPVMRARPQLCTLHAAALFLSGPSLEPVEARLRDAQDGAPDARVTGEVAAVRSLMAVLRMDLPASAELSRQARALLPADSLFLRSLVADNLGIVYMMSGDLEAATQALEEVTAISQKTGNVMMAVAALSNLAGMTMSQGQLRKAADLFRRALEIATDAQGQRLPVAGKALTGLGEVLRQWNDLDEAIHCLTDGIAVIKRYGEMGAVVGYASLALCRQAQGDASGAQAAIEAARQLAVRFDATDVDDRLLAAVQARLWIAEGQLEAATGWAVERGLDVDGPEGGAGASDKSSGGLTWPDLYELELLTLARLHLARGHADWALTVMQPLLEPAEKGKRMRRVIEILALQAVALTQTAGTGAPPAKALGALGRALSLAEPEGYVRVFLDEGEPMARLLAEAAARGIAPGYAGRLLAAFRSAGAALPVPIRPRPPLSELIEPLSERELEVLRKLATHLSSTEIAGELTVSANTVRFHIKNIYGKLNVHDRSAAVQRARELKLL